MGKVRGEKELCPGGSAAAALCWEVLLGAARDVEPASARNRGLSPWGPAAMLDLMHLPLTLCQRKLG